MKASSFLKATLASTVCLISLAAAPATQANVVIPTNGGLACQGTSGYGAHSFYFSNTYAENVDVSGQYLTCNLPVANAATATAPVNVFAYLVNTTGATINFTCAVQAGYEGGVGVLNTAVYQVAVGANTFVQLDSSPSSTPALPVANNMYGAFSMSCYVPVGGRISLISVTLPGNVL